MIYAIRAVGTEFIKFGKANSVGRRLRELECACPHELTILVVADWPDGAESAIHRLLEPMAERGEWFRDGVITRDVISWMANGQAGLERLHREMPIKTKRSWIAPVDVGVEKRREERKAYWKARECVT